MKFKIQNSKFKISAFSESGFGMVEMIVAIAIIVMTFFSILQVIFLERRAQILAREDASAYITARETMEATRSVRDSDWTNISTLTYSTAYYPEVNVSSQWELSASNPGPVGIYTRWVEFEEVFRDANDDISVSGTSDPDTLKATAYVQWTRPGGDTRTITLESYLTNWQGYQ